MSKTSIELLSYRSGKKRKKGNLSNSILRLSLYATCTFPLKHNHSYLICFQTLAFIFLCSATKLRLVTHKCANGGVDYLILLHQK